MASLNKVQPDLAELYAEGKSIPDIAAIIEAPRSRVRTQLIAAGVRLRNPQEAAKMSGKLGKHLIGKSSSLSAATKAKISAARLAWSADYAVGTSIKPNGYVEFTTGPHKGRLEHAVVMEARVGRRLHRDEVVHHIDGNKANNDIDNLALMTRAAHARLHRYEERLCRRAA